MTIFDHNGITQYRTVELATLAAAAYDGGTPPEGWTALTGEEVGFVDGFNHGTFNGDTFHGSALWGGQPAARVYRKGDAITISFRGTDSVADYATYPTIIGNNTYINAYDAFLTAVAAYIAAEGLTDVNVTGHSLGAAAANILRDESADRYDAAFDSATYVAIATPTVADNQDILNIGFENDWVFEAIPRNLPFVSSDFESATDNLVLYNDSYGSNGFLGAFDFFDVSAHSATGYIETIDRVQTSTYYDLMERDSVVVVVDTDSEVRDVWTVTSDHYGDSAFYVGRDANDLITGNDAGDFLDGLGGNDVLRGSGGEDVLNGGAGNDTLFGGDDSDRLVGGAGDDVLTGGDGSDYFYFSDGDGVDLITDFELDYWSWWNFYEGDAIVFDVAGYDDVDDVLAVATQQQDDVWFNFGDGDRLELADVSLTSVSWDDYLLFA